MKQEDERRWVEKILSADSQAFEAFVQQFQKPVFYTVLRFVNRVEIADEITQKTFIRAYQALSRFKFECSLKTWILTIAVNLAKTHLKQEKRWVSLEDQKLDLEFTEDASHLFQKEEDRIRLHQLLKALSPAQQTVVKLRIQEEISFKEIAQILESNERTVKVNFHHAMKRLKEMYQKKERHYE